MTHDEIGIGDVVYDLAQRSKMLVVDRAADTVKEYTRRESLDLGGYKSHPHLPVREDDVVFTCVYITEDPGSEPANTYDFPAGRLARFPVEQADPAVAPVKQTIARKLLECLFATATEQGDRELVDDVAALATDCGVAGDVVGQAREYVDAGVIGDHHE